MEMGMGMGTEVHYLHYVTAVIFVGIACYIGLFALTILHDTAMLERLPFFKSAPLRISMSVACMAMLYNSGVHFQGHQNPYVDLIWSSALLLSLALLHRLHHKYLFNSKMKRPMQGKKNSN